MSGAFAAIVLSVLMHVAWNLLVRHFDTRCNYLWWGLLAHLVLLGPWALWLFIVESQWNQTLVLALFVSALANTAYFLTLRKAYHFASVALVYPIVRSSPVLIAIWAWLIFDQGISGVAILGILINIVGLWLLAGTSRNGDMAKAIQWSLLAAVATSIYSLSDKVAVDYLPSFGAQLGFVTVGLAASFVGLTIAQYKETHRIFPQCRPKWFYILLGGLFIGTAYALVVRAMIDLPAAYVVTFTNMGIVLATVLSIWLFKERENFKVRLLASTIMSVGLVVLGSTL